jgi:hypothetical protein
MRTPRNTPLPSLNGLAHHLALECLCEMYWAEVASSGHAVPPAYNGMPLGNKHLETQWDTLHTYLGLAMAAGRLLSAQPSTWTTGWPG